MSFNGVPLPGIIGEAADAASKAKQWWDESPIVSKALEIGQQIEAPFEKAAATGADIAGKAAVEAVAPAPSPMHGTGEYEVPPAIAPKVKPAAQFQAEHPITTGIARGVGQEAGGMIADPRNWPFLAASRARPILQKAISATFGAMQAKGTVDGAQNAAQNWDRWTPEQRATEVTKVVSAAAMTAASADHLTKSAIAAVHGLDTTPNMHPDAAPTIVDQTMKNGGSSVDLWTGKPHEGNKTAVSFASSLKEEIPRAQFAEQGEEAIHAYANQEHIAPLLKKPNVTIGTSINPENGNVILEPTYLSRSENVAKEAGTYFKQQNVYHIGRGETIPTGGDGLPESQPPTDPLDRHAMLEAAQPKQTTQLFHHHSNSMIPADENGVSTLSGLQRFSSGIGTGGPRPSEPGVNLYDMKTPAEAQLGALKHEYRAITKGAYTDIAQEPYASIQREQGPQAAEQAVKADGFDGYTNSKVPGSYFHFGDVAARHTSKGPPPTPDELNAQRGSFTFDPSRKLDGGQLNAPRPAEDTQLGGGQAGDPMEMVKQAGLVGRHLLSDDPTSPIMVERPDLLGQGKQVTMKQADMTSPEAVKAALDAKLAEYGEKKVAGLPPILDNEPKVNSAPVERQPIEKPEMIPGATVSRPATTYQEATTTNTNPWVRSSADGVSHNSPSNAGRQVLVQFSSDLLDAHHGEPDAASAYYDKLYSGTREGFARLNDFWEIPQWMGYAAHFLPDADVYVVRDMNQAVKFLNDAKYDHVAFSALDANKDFIRELARGYPGQMDVGGYVDKSTFADLPHVKWHDSMQSLAADAGVPYHEGVDYRHFAGSDVVPRLTLSSGCLHKCAFCTIEKTLRMTDASVINQAADAIAGLGSKLVYINDKTFGQAKNYSMLADINARMKGNNPNFQGFVVQTTAAQMGKMTPEFLAKSGIKYVELGIESYNDPILKAMHKPATENLINKSVDQLRKAGIALIPNIMIGLPGETPETYQNTLNFLMDNKDIISHANIYNLAVYKNTELAKQLTTASPDDFNENVTEKSFHDDPAIVQKFAGDVYGSANKLLDRSPEALAPAKPMSEVMKAMGLDPVDLLRPEEKARMGASALKQLRKEYAALPPIEEAVAATKAGLSGADWWKRGQQLYPALSEADDHFFPSDPAEQKKFANVMGSTSPHQAVETAELEALHVWNQYRTKIVDAGKPVTPENIRKYVKLLSLPGAKQNAVIASLMGQDVFGVGRVDRGLKRASMGQALGGGPEGSDPNEAYVGDTHMADLKGIEPSNRPFNSSAVYYAMAAQDRAVARQLNMHLADVQAAQWATKMAIQNVMGEMPDASAETILGRIDSGTINQYKKDLIDIMRTDPIIQRYMVEEYGFEPAKLAKLNEKLAAVPKETLGQSVPASHLAPQLEAGVERLRSKYGKPVSDQGAIGFGPEGSDSFNFGANTSGVPSIISDAVDSTKAKRK